MKKGKTIISNTSLSKTRSKNCAIVRFAHSINVYS
jgi:hypothetical protein